MPYSLAGPSIQVMKGDTNEALQSVMTAYGHMNDAYDKIAKLPGMAKTMVQDDADARYTAALNRYANDPNGLAQALANNQIDTSNVRAETLGKTQDTLKNIQANRVLGYVQDREETANKWWDANSKLYQEAVYEAQNGHPEKLNQIRMNQLDGAPWEVAQTFSKLDAITQQNKLAELDIARRNAANSGMAAKLAYDKYAAHGNAAKGYLLFSTLASEANYGNSPDLDKTFFEGFMNGTLQDAKGNYIPGTREAAIAMLMDDDYSKLFNERGGLNLRKASGLGADQTPPKEVKKETNQTDNDANAIAGTGY